MSLANIRLGGFLCRRCQKAVFTPSIGVSKVHSSYHNVKRNFAVFLSKKNQQNQQQQGKHGGGVYMMNITQTQKPDTQSLAIKLLPTVWNYCMQRSFHVSVNNKMQISADTEAKKAEEKQSSWRSWSYWSGKNAWRAVTLYLGVMFVSGGGLIVSNYGAPERDEEGNEVEDVYSGSVKPIAYIKRAWQAVMAFTQMVKDPTSEKLLPDPLKPPYIQPPYTLVLELTDVLLKAEWDMKMGWRFKKRPGLDYFLQQCAQNGFEIVIFSVESASVGFPLTVSMDPQGTIWYRLFKEDTRYTAGVHIKDLSCLNRDLSRVILVDVNKDSYKLNPRNGMTLKKWNGKDDDRELYDLAALLHTVASAKVEDVRPVLDYYSQFEDPMQKFRENQAELMKAQNEMAKLQQEEAKKGQITKSPFIPSNLGRR